MPVVLASLAPCGRCGRGPLETGFYASGEGKRDAWCRDCRRVYMREYMRCTRGGTHTPCVVCGEPTYGRKACCSPECTRTRDEAVRQERRERVAECGVCGVRFLAFTGRRRRKFCSSACTSQATKARQYGLTPEAYRALRERAGGHCEMCGVAFESQENAFAPMPGLHMIDHCHETGRVRGLLCGGCNIYLGHFEKVRANAERYLAAFG